MKLITGTVKFQARNVSTRYGQKSNAVFILEDGTEQTVWGPANHPPLFALSKGSVATLGMNGNGKYSLVENAPLPAAAMPLSNPGTHALQDYLDDQAKLYRDCYITAVNAMSGLMDSTEDFRSVATTLFIQAQKELPNLKSRIAEFKPVPLKPVTLPPVYPAGMNGNSRKVGGFSIE